MLELHKGFGLSKDIQAPVIFQISHKCYERRPCLLLGNTEKVVTPLICISEVNVIKVRMCWRKACV